MCSFRGMKKEKRTIQSFQQFHRRTKSAEPNVLVSTCHSRLKS